MAAPPRNRSEWLIMLQQRMDEFFTFLMKVEERGKRPEADQTPQVDMYETSSELVVEIELPGCEREDVTLKLCGPVLVVEAIKREEPRNGGITYICLERKFGRYYRIIEIPPFVELNAIQARFRRGLLRVSFPLAGRGSAMLRQIPIGE